MISTPRQLLRLLARGAADAVLATPAYAGRDVDPVRFAEANLDQLLLLIARYPPLRADLAARYHAALTDSDPLLRRLTDPDGGAAREAATILGRDPGRLAATVPPRPAPPRAVKPATSVEERRAHRAARDLSEARTARDRARGQLEWATRERDLARQELAGALADRDEALAVVESLRAALALERRRSAALGSSVRHAAELLAGLARPALTAARGDPDPRERERPDAGPAEPAPGGAGRARGPDGARLTAALDVAGVSRDAFLAVLDLLRAPEPPARPAPASTRSRDVVVTALGGGTEIGGSCLLVEVGSARLLVDAGLRPRQPPWHAGPPGLDGARPGRLDAIVVTHAHNDHAGYVPALTAEGAGPPVICTPDTAALLPAMWADCAKVFDRTVRGYPARGAPGMESPYGQVRVAVAQQCLRPTRFGKTIDVADGVTVELFPAGHILGAAGVVISAGSTRVTVTGDVSDRAQATVSGLVVPPSARGSDLLVIESTNCQRYSRRDADVENLLAVVLETVSTGGRVLVPAFALGRAQEVALTLRRGLPDVPVLIDGMAKQITHIYEQQTGDRDHPLRIFGEQVREVAPEQRRQLIAAFRRGVVIATSGMLTAGPALQWARSVLPDPAAALLLAGYQDEESPGGALLEVAEGAQSAFVLDGRSVEVRARVATFGLSAHADQNGLRSIIDDIDAGAVMLVHGLGGAQRAFGEQLRRRGRRIVPTGRWAR
jgi:uncharacterized protein